MTRLDALKALAEKVEAGEWDFSHTAPARIVFPYQSASVDDLGLTARAAFDGSLDAAKALHEAVLPRWGFKVCPQYALVIDPENIYGRTRFDRDAVQTENPARAWLLAILRALIAQEESK